MVGDGLLRVLRSVPSYCADEGCLDQAWAWVEVALRATVAHPYPGRRRRHGLDLLVLDHTSSPLRSAPLLLDDPRPHCVGAQLVAVRPGKRAGFHEALRE